MDLRLNFSDFLYRSWKHWAFPTPWLHVWNNDLENVSPGNDTLFQTQRFLIYLNSNARSQVVVLMTIGLVKHSATQKYRRHFYKECLTWKNKDVMRIYFFPVFWEGQAPKIIVLQLWCACRILNYFWLGRMFIEKREQPFFTKNTFFIITQFL